MLVRILIAIFLLSAAQAAAQPRLRIRRGALINDLGRDLFSMTELSPTVFLEEVGGDARGQIDLLNRHVEGSQWREAAETLRRLADQRAPGMTKLGLQQGGFQQHVPLAELVRSQLAEVARQSPESLAAYRQRMNPLAAQWFEAGQIGDHELLEKCAFEATQSDVGDDALLALAELSIESGDFAKARRCLRSIHGGMAWYQKSSLAPFWLRHARGEEFATILADMESVATSNPACVDSDIPMADVWSRMTLVSILEGNRERAMHELALLQEKWPNSSGRIGGRNTEYGTYLEGLLAASAEWSLPSRADQWTTFAGNAARNGQSATSIDIPMEPAWRTVLRSAKPSSAAAARAHNLPTEKSGEVRGRPLSHHPVVMDGKVLIQDRSRIRCLDLNTGKPAWGGDDGEFYANRVPVAGDVRFVPFDGRTQTARINEQRFTLTATPQTILATIASNHDFGGGGNAAIAGFNIEREGSLQFGPIELKNGLSFLGSPVAEGDQCWVGVRNQEANVQDFVASYDMQTGKELWRTRICSADTINRTAELASYLLTKWEDTIYFSSHLGAVAALDAEEGAIRWITTYPRTGPKRRNLVDQPWYALRDLTPCLYHDGVLVVAPSDTDRIFALHADTGSLLWEVEIAGDANQLLGVGKDGHLIVSGRRLWWLDVWTGARVEDLPVNPFPAGDMTVPTGAGRGVLAGGNIYWPAQDSDGAKIFVLDQANGEQNRQPIDLDSRNVKAGNLIATSTHLLIASPDELVTFAIADHQ